MGHCLCLLPTTVLRTGRKGVFLASKMVNANGDQISAPHAGAPARGLPFGGYGSAPRRRHCDTRSPEGLSKSVPTYRSGFSMVFFVVLVLFYDDSCYSDGPHVQIPRFGGDLWGFGGILRLWLRAQHSLTVVLSDRPANAQRLRTPRGPSLQCGRGGTWPPTHHPGGARGGQRAEKTTKNPWKGMIFSHRGRHKAETICHPAEAPTEQPGVWKWR